MMNENVITEEMISAALKEVLSVEAIKQRGFIKAGDIFGFGYNEDKLPNWVLAYNELFANTQWKCGRSFDYHLDPNAQRYEAFVYECPPYIEDKENYLQEEGRIYEASSFDDIPCGKLYAIFTNMDYFDPSAKSWYSNQSATKFLGLCRFNKEKSIQNNRVIWEKISDTLVLD